MRALTAVLALFPTALMADDIALATDVAAVTLYPDGATIVREAPFSTPAGAHQLILTDLPRNTPLASVRVEVQGATLGAVSTRRDFVPPRSAETDAAVAAAKAEVERLEAALRDGEAAVEAIRLEAQAARARVKFLEALGRADGLAALDVTALRAMLAMIGDETLAALRAVQDAGRRAAEADRDLKQLREDLKRARQALNALVPETEKRALLAVNLRSDTPAEGKLRVIYNIQDAGWQPVYDLRLSRDSGALAIERGALVRQMTGENWRDVALTLSTTRPSEQTEPSEVWPWLRRIYDPDAPVPRPLTRSRAEAGSAADAMMEQPMVMAEPVTAEAAFDGLSVSYDYPDPVSVASGADNLRILLGTLDASAELVAQAAPLSDQTAYLVASFTNQTDELILPTSEANFYLDGRFVGRRHIDLIPAGGEARLGFGPVDGLRLSRTVLERSEGDRGVISRSNELTEKVEIEVENLTGQSWPMRVIDRVPYSEQEDLEITWSAAPRPTQVDVDGKRGVLAWEFDLPAGARQVIRLTHSLEWPEGMILQ